MTYRVRIQGTRNKWTKIVAASRMEVLQIVTSQGHGPRAIIEIREMKQTNYLWKQPTPSKKRTI